MVEQRWPGEDEEEFAALYAEHFARLVRWVTVIFGPDHAEDIAQEALFRLYLRPTFLTPGVDPWRWLSVVARNIGRDRAREGQYRTPTDPDDLSRLPAPEASVDPVERGHDLDTMREALSRLSPEERYLLQLRDLEERSAIDIANLLDITPNAVRQRVFRARQRLADTFALLDAPPSPERTPAPRRRERPEVRPVPRRRSPNEPCVCGRPSCRVR